MTRVPQVAVGAVIIEHRADAPYVVLVRRAKPPYEGRWSLPGGRLEAGELLTAAVAREAREETGLEVKVGSLIEAVEIIDARFHYVILEYLCERVGGQLRAGTDANGVVTVPVFDLGDYDVTAAVRRVISRAIADARE